VLPFFFSILLFSPFLKRERKHTPSSASEYAYACTQPTDQLESIRSYQQTTTRKEKHGTDFGRNEREKKGNPGSHLRPVRPKKKKKKEKKFIK
jgi:hypothetical protein